MATRTKLSGEVATHAIMLHFPCGRAGMPDVEECPCGQSQVLVCPNCKAVLALGRTDRPCEHAQRLARELGMGER